MGVYLNPGNKSFQDSLNSKIYVDKTDLLSFTNAVLNTEQKYLCVSRPRRFGKSMALNMLAAYYGRDADSGTQFQGLQISKSADYKKHLNQYDVIKMNMQEFLSGSDNLQDMLRRLKDYLLFDLEEEYHSIRLRDRNHLPQVMKDIYAKTRRPFIVLIDEWDCLLREHRREEEQKAYLDFLRSWLKDQEFTALVYMTGILPIKKYGTHSALNMFSEYSMTNPRVLAPYFGFTEEETRQLCSTFHKSFEEISAWYDGYRLAGIYHGQPFRYSIYNPKSVVDALLGGVLDTYWNNTETYEALKIYIQMNMDGLKDAVISLLGGGFVPVNTGTFHNDMTTFSSKDDVLTLLVHLGYLNYNAGDHTVSIPNKEVAAEFENAIRTMNWSAIAQLLRDSRQLLIALWDLDAESASAGVDSAHDQFPAITYNNENSLSCTIQLAFYFAREYYTMVRELPTGKGFADLCLIPRRVHAEKPAAIIELKWDQSAKGALDQIKEKNYGNSLSDYHGYLLLAGINYDRKTKVHTCRIEKVKL